MGLLAVIPDLSSKVGFTKGKMWKYDGGYALSFV